MNSSIAQIGGHWERYGDKFSGCVVGIEISGDEIIGRLIIVPSSMRIYGWNEGDLKWRHIRPRRFRRHYHFLDLVKHYDSTSGSVIDVKYLHFKFILKRNLHRAVLRQIGWFSPRQTWRKI